MSAPEVTEEMVKAGQAALVAAARAAGFPAQADALDDHMRARYASIYRAMHLHRPLSEGPKP